MPRVLLVEGCGHGEGAFVLVAAEGLGVGLGRFAGEPHDEGQRREAEDGEGEDREGVFVAEHGRLADHLLVGFADRRL